MTVRVRVLPRETAAAVITSAVSAVGWAVAVAVIVTTVPLLVETLTLTDRLADLPVVLILLGVVLAGVVTVALRPRRWVVLVYLGGAGLATIGYQVTLLTGNPGIVESSPYLVNRPSLALVLVGIPATRALIGIAWSAVGFVVAAVVAVVSFSIADVPFTPGLGPLMVLAVTAIAYLTLAAVQARIRAHVPNFDELEEETRALAHGEDLARRTTAVVHDTLLNGLAVVMNAPDRLDDRARDRLLADLETLTGADWITTTADADLITAEDAVLRNELARLASEYQWRGVNLQITAQASGRYELSADVADALLGAVRATLENVVRHSEATSAVVELITDAHHVTVMVTDQGRGFDPGAVGADRLGLRTSVVARMAAVGGNVKIWSAPGEGTSVIISAPIAEAVGS